MSRQIHGELDKIHCAMHAKKAPAPLPKDLILGDADSDRKHNDDDDDEKKESSLVAPLLPFQSLVHQIQKQMDPNLATSSSSSSSDTEPDTTTSTKPLSLNEAELASMHDFVREHRHKMQEKTYQYEEKRKQLHNAKERLNAAKARFKRRIKSVIFNFLKNFL